MATTGRSRVRAGLQLWGAKRLSGSLLWWAAALAALTLITRIPFRSTHLFAWDSANFALALQHYNVAWHQPQPPGYILYVAVARLVHLLVADANAAYVWLSVVVSVGAVWCVVLVGGRLFGITHRRPRRAGAARLARSSGDRAWSPTPTPSWPFSLP